MVEEEYYILPSTPVNPSPENIQSLLLVQDLHLKHLRFSILPRRETLILTGILPACYGSGIVVVRYNRISNQQLIHLVLMVDQGGGGSDGRGGGGTPVFPGSSFVTGHLGQGYVGGSGEPIIWL